LRTAHEGESIEPFGAYAPSAMQRRVIAAVRATPLHRGVFRDAVVRALLWLRPGPIDWQVNGASFRLRLQGNGTDIGLLLKPAFDAVEIAFLAEAARDGVFVDVGANIGAYTVLVAAAAGRCRVLAIEPLAILAAQLRANVALNNFREVTVIEHAVGEAEGRISLAVDAANLGATSASGEGGSHAVQVRPLFAALRDAGVDGVSALKIDVEGYEDRVLVPFFGSAPRGLWPRRVVIEHLQRRDWRQDCITDMRDRGYVIAGETRSNTLLARPG
jgi:FkbM family methyltransferase